MAHPTVYLDDNATTRVADEVLAAITLTPAILLSRPTLLSRPPLPCTTQP
ncbi:MAG TPA: hypothetical protein VMS56_12865 [Thermoanaerobaculia bacterium]|nr:hypothetical protein [Thermoanaerobaculia bacterium]